MRGKTLALASLAVVMFGVLGTTDAFAAGAYWQPESAWYTGSPATKLPEGSTKPLNMEVGTKLALESTVGGKAVTITLPSVVCSSCVITNVSAWAKEEGTLQFKEATLSAPEPTNCGVTGTIETAKLKATVGMKSGTATIATIKFEPASGTTLATIEILGPKCPIAGTYSLTGALYAEMSKATFVSTKVQPINMSKAIQESAGTATSLKLGENNASVTGTVDQITEVETAVEGPPSEPNLYSESGSAWYTGASPGTKLAEGTTKSITTKTAAKPTLEVTIAGSTFKLEASNLECSVCTIKNVGASAVEEATFLFKEATVSQPAGCGVPGTIKTNRLRGTVGTKDDAPKVGTLKYLPETGTTLFTLEITGATCALAGTYKITGTIFGEMASATGVFGKTQSIKMGKAVQESAGTAGSVKLGENPMFLTASVDTTAEVEYAAKEK